MVVVVGNVSELAVSVSGRIVTFDVDAGSYFIFIP